MSTLPFKTLVFLAIAIVASSTALAEVRFRNLSVDTVAGRKVQLNSGTSYHFCPNGVLIDENPQGQRSKGTWRIEKNLGGQNYIREVDEDGDEHMVFFLQNGDDVFLTYGTDGRNRGRRIIGYGAAQCK